MKVLIANRGEIAVRVIKTCRRLNIPTVAVYSTADANALHVRLADEAICIGPPITSESYLNIQNVLAACKTSGATHVHPGYGFLSENAEFARQLKSNGIVFIGPQPESILSIGDKMRAKRLLREHAPAVPLIPGYDGDNQNVELLISKAIEIGFPVLIKASAGGGGKGMRVVRDSSKLREEIEMAKGEALRSFGDDKLLIEKYFEHVKHIEVQIIGDCFGNVFHCFERECSVQRRHQKVIEETPSPALDAELRRKITEAALMIGKLIKYENAGTVEFIFDAKTRKFYFLEVNTRLQVEHPITEAITGLDLVELQLHVARGKSLVGMGLESLRINGHAIEARLYAEDPNNNFFPCTGTVQYWSHPTPISSSYPYPRFDTSIVSGSSISVYYDPLIAKITVHGKSREETIQSMRQVLGKTVCLGVITNKSFLIDVMNIKDFLHGSYTTRLVDDVIGTTGIGFPLERFQKTGLILRPVQNQLLDRLEKVPHQSLKYPPSPPSSPSSVEKLKLDIVHEALIAAAFYNVFDIQKASKGTLYSQIPFGFRLVRWSPQKLGFRVTSPLHSSASGSIDSSSRLVVEYIFADNGHSLQRRNSYFARVVKEHLDRKHHPSSGGKKSEKNPVWQVESVSQWIPILDVRVVDSSSTNVAAKINISWGADGYLKSYTIVQLEPNGQQSHSECFVHNDGWNRQIILHHLSLRDSLVDQGADAQSAYTSTMPCRIIKVMINNGQRVKKGEVLLTTESMKMEIRLYSSHEGTVKILVSEGQVVEAGTKMIHIEEDE